MDFWIIFLFLLGLVLLATLTCFCQNEKKRTEQVKEINYQAFFFLGISFMGMGTALRAAISPGFMGIKALGTIYMSIVLNNRDK